MTKFCTAIPTNPAHRFHTFAASDPAPTVASVTPTNGPESTATAITVNGANFVSGATVAINGVACTGVVFVNSGQITCSTPSSIVAGGPYALRVTNPDAQFGDLAGAFTFDAPGFNPLSVGVPLVWYDLGVCTQGGGIVTALPDQSGNANHATLPAGNEPGYTAANAAFNNLPTFDIPAADTKHVTVPDLGQTLFATSFVIVCSAAASAAYMFSANNAKAEVYAPAGTVTASNDDGTTNLTGPAMPAVAVIVYIADGASSKLYVNAHTPSTGDAGAQDLTGQTIRLGHYGAGLSGAFGWEQAGSTAHFLAYVGALSQADVEYLLDGFGALAGVAIGP